MAKQNENENENKDDCGCGSNPLCKCVDGKRVFIKIPTNG